MSLTKSGQIACDYCGKFISFAQLDSGEAQHVLTTPDSHFTKEEYESYHISCEEREVKRGTNG